MNLQRPAHVAPIYLSRSTRPRTSAPLHLLTQRAPTRTHVSPAGTADGTPPLPETRSSSDHCVSTGKFAPAPFVVSSRPKVRPPQRAKTSGVQVLQRFQRRSALANHFLFFFGRGVPRSVCVQVVRVCLGMRLSRA